MTGASEGSLKSPDWEALPFETPPATVLSLNSQDLLFELAAFSSEALILSSCILVVFFWVKEL